jgi:putative FmdB family regulatory protein
MPIYEYACQKCGKKTEAIQRMGEKTLKICPHCGGNDLKKLASAPAIQFKGSGFYKTDYPSATRESGKAEGQSASSGKSESGEKAEKRDSGEKAEKRDSAEKAEKRDSAEKAEKAAEKRSDKPAEKKKEKKAKE